MFSTTLAFINLVDLSTVDSTSEASEDATSLIVDELVSAFQRYNKSLMETSDTDTHKHQSSEVAVIAAAFKSGVNHPGIFRQFKVLFRFGPP